MKPKILIASPTYDHEAYCLDRFVKGLKRLTYKNADILIVDNSKGNKYFDLWKTVKIPGRKITVLKDEHTDTRLSRIITSRNIIRQYALDNNHDYLFSIDSDMTTPKDAIEQLIRTDADIASGVYLCNQKIGDEHHVQPAIFRPNDDGSVITVTTKEVMPNKLMAVAVCGLGCILVRKKVLEDVEFRSFYESKTGGEDVAFCVDARKKGHKIIANTAVKCAHMGKKYVHIFGKE